MNSLTTSAVIFLCLSVAIGIGRVLRRLLPGHHLNVDSRDAIKTAMGMVVTMTALLLGLLLASAKSAYDSERGEVIEMAGRLSHLNRVLAGYGLEATNVRFLLRDTVREAVRQMWSEPAAARESSHGDTMFEEIELLQPKTDAQKARKSEAIGVAIELARVRSQLEAQASPSISVVLLCVVVGWLVVVFISFGLLSPPNSTATLASLTAALAVAGALFLILELDRPFGGVILISSQPLLDALNQIR